MQSTVRPARFMTARAPSKCRAHLPTVRPSHSECAHGPSAFGAWREMRTTSYPSASRWRARLRPMKPVPPVMTTLPVGEASMVGAFNIGLALSVGLLERQTPFFNEERQKSDPISAREFIETCLEHCSDDILVIDRRGFSEFYPPRRIAAGMRNWPRDPQWHGTFP